MNNKNFLWIGAGVIVVIIIIALVAGKSDNTGISLSPTTSPLVTISVNPSASVKATPKPSSAPVSTLSYQTALQKYGSTRMQFDATCQATPSHMVLKNGSPLMFDNRASVARTISFNGTKYSVQGYGFRIVTALASKFPTTALIDCGSSQNVATVTIEK